MHKKKENTYLPNILGKHTVEFKRKENYFSKNALTFKDVAYTLKLFTYFNVLSSFLRITSFESAIWNFTTAINQLDIEKWE